MDNCLHIYAQTDWHSEAYIVGTSDALTALRDAINRALEKETGSAESYVNDGEGFDTIVACLNNQEEIDKLAVPYTAEIAQEHDVHAKDPWDMKIIRKEVQECHDLRHRRRKNKHKHHDIGGEG